MTKDSNDNIETIEAEEINPSDSSSNSNIPKRKGGRPKKTDKDILSNIPHYFITQPNDVTQAISNLTAVERNCWLQIIRGIQKKKDLPDGHPENTRLRSHVPSFWNVSPGIVPIWIMPSMHSRISRMLRRFFIPRMDTVFMPVFCHMLMSIQIRKLIL